MKVSKPCEVPGLSTLMEDSAGPSSVSGDDRLPDDLLRVVLSHLDPTTLHEVSEVCHHLESIVRETGFKGAAVPLPSEASEARLLVKANNRLGGLSQLVLQLPMPDTTPRPRQLTQSGSLSRRTSLGDRPGLTGRRSLDVRTPSYGGEHPHPHQTHHHQLQPSSSVPVHSHMGSLGGNSSGGKLLASPSSFVPPSPGASSALPSPGASPASAQQQRRGGVGGADPIPSLSRMDSITSSGGGSLLDSLGSTPLPDSFLSESPLEGFLSALVKDGRAGRSLQALRIRAAPGADATGAAHSLLLGRALPSPGGARVGSGSLDGSHAGGFLSREASMDHAHGPPTCGSGGCAAMHWAVNGRALELLAQAAPGLQRLVLGAPLLPAAAPQLSALQELKSLRSLTLVVADSGTVDTALALSQLSHLSLETSRGLMYLTLSMSQLQALGRMPCLKSLYLTNVVVPDSRASFEPLAQLSRLTELRVSFPIAPERVTACLPAIKKLEMPYFSSPLAMTPTDYEVQIMAGGSPPPPLLLLPWAGTPGPGTPTVEGGWRTLTELRLRQQALQAQDLAALSALPMLETLQADSIVFPVYTPPPPAPAPAAAAAAAPAAPGVPIAPMQLPLQLFGAPPPLAAEAAATLGDAWAAPAAVAAAEPPVADPVADAAAALRALLPQLPRVKQLKLVGVQHSPGLLGAAFPSLESLVLTAVDGHSVEAQHARLAAALAALQQPEPAANAAAAPGTIAAAAAAGAAAAVAQPAGAQPAVPATPRPGTLSALAAAAIAAGQLTKAAAAAVAATAVPLPHLKRLSLPAAKAAPALLAAAPGVESLLVTRLSCPARLEELLAAPVWPAAVRSLHLGMCSSSLRFKPRTLQAILEDKLPPALIGSLHSLTLRDGPGLGGSPTPAAHAVAAAGASQAAAATAGVVMEAGRMVDDGVVTAACVRLRNLKSLRLMACGSVTCNGLSAAIAGHSHSLGKLEVAGCPKVRRSRCERLPADLGRVFLTVEWHEGVPPAWMACE